MKIKWIKLKNFHGFIDTNFTFDDKFTVLVGENGSGKTAILDGVTVALSVYINELYNTQKREIHPDDVRIKRIVHDEITTLEPQYPSMVECCGVLEDVYNCDVELYWSREKLVSGTQTIGNHEEINNFAKEIQKAIQNGFDNLLPIFVYYGTKRLWSSNKREVILDPFKPVSRFAGYHDYLHPDSSEKMFIRWFIQMSLAEIKHNKELKVLASVRRAITTCLERVGFKALDYDPLTNEIYAVKTDETMLPFQLLSDGFRNMIGMVADIAYRMALLNPFLDNHLETPGVVLIDELDLHLHPKWQRHVVEDLKSAFPNVQFIVTTHSPFIVQSLLPGELRRLGENTEYAIYEIPPSRYVNQSLEDVSTNVMGIQHPQRSQKLQRLHEITKEYYKAVKESVEAPPEEKPQKQARIDMLKSEIDELASIFSNNVAYYAILELEREELERKGRNEAN